MTRSDMAKILISLQVIWPETAIDEPLITAYHNLLADLPYVAVDGAARWHMADEKWFPKPSELRNKAITLLDGIVPFYSYPGLGNTGLQRQVRLAVNAYGSAQLEA